jgi:hypothetical protein
MAENMLTSLLGQVRPDTHYGFYTGLSGIGWGIEYLYEQGFIEGNPNDILADFDKKVMETDPMRAVNLNRDHGFGGIVLYLLARLYTIRKENRENPFDNEYLTNVYKRLYLVVEQRDTKCESMDIFLDFLNFYEGRKEIEKPEIYDVWCLLNPQNIHIRDLEPGLTGASGVGLKLILDNTT